LKATKRTKRDAVKAKTNPSRTTAETLDLDPDAWPKFEALVKSAAKMGPQPHLSKKPKKASRERSN
jgi:hypothetical protein